MTALIAHMMEAITAGYICVAMDYGLASTAKWFFRHDISDLQSREKILVKSYSALFLSLTSQSERLLLSTRDLTSTQKFSKIFDCCSVLIHGLFSLTPLIRRFHDFELRSEDGKGSRLDFTAMLKNNR